MRITRRTFVKGSAALPVLPILGAGCGNDVRAAAIVEVAAADVGTDSAKPDYGKITVRVKQHPDLAAVGGAVMLRVAPLPSDDFRLFEVPEGGVLLIHRDAQAGGDEFVATAADCPHQGCPLGYNADDDQIQCPCHSSRFRTTADPADEEQVVGSVMHLPARQNLLAYRVERLDAMTVLVDLNDAVSLPAVENGKITIPLDDDRFRSLGEVGRSLIGVSLGPTRRLRLMIACVAADQFVVVSAVCSHMHRDIAFNGTDLAARQFHCSGHGSRFNFDGSVREGPAVDPIQKYDALLDGTNLVVTVG